MASPDLEFFMIKYQALLDDPRSLMDEDAKFEIHMLLNLLHQLKERQEKDCNCELIPAKNEAIDSGFVCVHCGKIYAEYKGSKITTGD